MNSYPMVFKASAVSGSGIENEWTAATGEERSLICSIPKEFSGPSTGFSPEDLYLLALINCYVATFKVIALNSKFSFLQLAGSGSLTLDRDVQTSSPWMVKGELSFELRGVNDELKATRLLERVAKQCMILNSVKTAIIYNFSVVLA